MAETMAPKSPSACDRSKAFCRSIRPGLWTLASEVAKWFWRWTLPVAPYDKAVFYTRTAPATVVHVVPPQTAS